MRKFKIIFISLVLIGIAGSATAGWFSDFKNLFIKEEPITLLGDSSVRDFFRYNYTTGLMYTTITNTLFASTTTSTLATVEIQGTLG